MIKHKRLAKEGLRQLVLCALLANGLGAFAQNGADRATPSLSLSLYGRESIVQPNDEPLLVSIIMSNKVATNLLLDNIARQTLSEGAPDGSEPKKAASKSVSEKLPVVITIGSAQRPVRDIIRFRVTSNGGKVIETQVKPLAITQSKPGSISLDGQTVGRFFYGIQPADLAKLSDAEYQIVAQIASNELPGSSGEDAVSNVVTFRLAKPSQAATAGSLYASGKYYLLDRQLDKADSYASRLKQLVPNCPEAYELLGDADFERGKLAAARDSYEKGIDLFVRRASSNTAGTNAGLVEAEPPHYLIRRLAEVDDRIESSKGR